MQKFVGFFLINRFSSFVSRRKFAKPKLSSRSLSQGLPNRTEIFNPPTIQLSLGKLAGFGYLVSCWNSLAKEGEAATLAPPSGEETSPV
jgi:hypothetical protein